MICEGYSNVLGNEAVMACLWIVKEIKKNFQRNPETKIVIDSTISALKSCVVGDVPSEGLLARFQNPQIDEIFKTSKNKNKQQQKNSFERSFDEEGEIKPTQWTGDESALVGLLNGLTVAFQISVFSEFKDSFHGENLKNVSALIGDGVGIISAFAIAQSLGGRPIVEAATRAVVMAFGCCDKIVSKSVEFRESSELLRGSSQIPIIRARDGNDISKVFHFKSPSSMFSLSTQLLFFQTNKISV